MFFRQCVLTIMVLFSSAALAFTPTAKQIEQFKKLPKAQQEALAAQYGIDLSSLNNVTKPSQSDEKSQITPAKRQKRDAEVQSEEDSFDPTKNKLKPFGYELFDVQPQGFVAQQNANVPNDYIIAQGDTIAVTLYGKESASYTITVDNEGRLSIPKFTPITVAGLSYGELKSLIKNKVTQEAIGLSAYTSMAELRPIQVMIVGEANQPGSYTLSPLSKVTEALFAAGVTELASLRNIQVKRSGETVANLDLYKLLLNGNSKGDINLRAGDVIFIPTVGPQVTVEGAVKRAGIFELLPSDNKNDLIKMFAGFKENAYTKRVHIKRVIDGRKSIALSANFDASNNAYQPQGGDHITVQTVSDDVVDSVTLIGAVVRPGDYQWQPGLTVSNIIEDGKSDLLPQADYNYALIVREKSAGQALEVLQFSLADVFTGKQVELQKNDQVFVFSRFEQKQAEQTALKSLALTAEQQLQQEKTKLWHLFKQHEFINKVSSFSETLETLVAQQEEPADEVQSNSWQSNINTSSQTNLGGSYSGSQSALRMIANLDEYALFSRTRLLQPLIKRLNYQTDFGSRAAVFEVLGQVRFPGVYPLTKEMTVAKALVAAGGLNQAANRSQAEITRVSSSGDRKISHLKVALSQSDELQIQLKDQDTLNILTRANWQEAYKVHLHGEVRHPGTYSIRRGEKLREVIARAGGLSEYAEPNAAIFTRESIRQQEQQQLKKLSNELRKDIASKSFQKSIGMNNSISYEEMNMLLNDLASVEALGRLVIDLPQVLEGHEKVVLQDGDSLYIPGKQDSISIIGEVNYASSYLFKPGLGIDDYLELSGGVKDRANEEQIYVIKANGAVFIPQPSSWFAVEEHARNQLEPGDTIVVPMDASHMDNLTLWSTATQIFYQLGVGIAAIARI